MSTAHISSALVRKAATAFLARHWREVDDAVEAQIREEQNLRELHNGHFWRKRLSTDRESILEDFSGVGEWGISVLESIKSRNGSSAQRVMKLKLTAMLANQSDVCSVVTLTVEDAALLQPFSGGDWA